MSRAPAKRDIHALSLKIGSWFEAQASGWGLAAILVLVGLVLAAAVAAGRLG
ncbi:hypothetical protein [Phenylobacterium sp.]|uniref:hypothetical protein n=1 Tax=Phenylobacterium sp. TaxID=1871053 RepID=UPI0035B1BD1E